MPFSRLVGGVQIGFVCELGGSVSQATLTFIRGGAPFTLEPAAFVANRGFWWQYFMMPLLSAELNYLRAEGRDLDTDGHIFSIVPPDAVTTGGVAGQAHSANVAFRATHVVERGAGLHNGWMMVPGIPRSAVVGNTLDRAFTGPVLETLNINLSTGEGTGWLWVVQNKWSAGFFLNPSAAARVLGSEQRSPWISQRRSRLHNTPT